MPKAEADAAVLALNESEYRVIVKNVSVDHLAAHGLEKVTELLIVDLEKQIADVKFFDHSRPHRSMRSARPRKTAPWSLRKSSPISLAHAKPRDLRLKSSRKR